MLRGWRVKGMVGIEGSKSSPFQIKEGSSSGIRMGMPVRGGRLKPGIGTRKDSTG